MKFINNLTLKIWQKTSYSVIRRRLQVANSYRKENFILKGETNVFDKIYAQNYWNNSESASGAGSSLYSTAKIRKYLPILWKKYKVKTFLDVPCGDFNWMKVVDKSEITYIGGDIVQSIINENIKKYQQSNISFRILDITRSTIPSVDMIFCKDCLQHLSDENVKKALINFKQSGSKYLLVTSYPLTKKNWDICDGDYRPLNLKLSPFSLPKPLYEIHENETAHNERDKYMLLYELKNIQII
ncbi:hypothetical protein FACS189451_03200 [Bacteroidia bacterium]|nr:hypothetical protein FACS189451_03200 [Bacteroidia bacterium]